MTAERFVFFPTRLIETGQGTLVCRQVGMVNAAVEPVVLLHGIQGTSSVWHDVLPGLGRRRWIVAPDLRGRGFSTSPARVAAYELSDFSGDLAAVVAEIGRPVKLVGCGMGVLVALHYIRWCGIRNLSSLVLISGSACLDPGGMPPAQWFQGDTDADVMEDAPRRAERLGLTDTASLIAVAGAWRSVRRADYRDLLPGIGLPTLVLHGSDDTDCPVAQGSALALGLPQACFEVWEGCGHMLMAQGRERFVSRLETFWNDCASGEVTG